MSWGKLLLPPTQQLYLAVLWPRVKRGLDDLKAAGIMITLHTLQMMAEITTNTGESNNHLPIQVPQGLL